MHRVRTFALFGLIAACAPLAAFAADSGKIIYGKGNCFVIETGKGKTLFERSGGLFPKEGDAIKGEMSDFGYQQLYDSGGKEVMVGFVQEYSVKTTENVEAFKKSCR